MYYCTHQSCLTPKRFLSDQIWCGSTTQCSNAKLIVHPLRNICAPFFLMVYFWGFYSLSLSQFIWAVCHCGNWICKDFFFFLNWICSKHWFTLYGLVDCNASCKCFVSSCVVHNVNVGMTLERPAVLKSLDGARKCHRLNKTAELAFFPCVFLFLHRIYELLVITGVKFSN